MFVEQVGVKDIEFVSLDSFGWRVIIIVMHSIVLIPLYGHSFPIDVLWFPVPEPTLGLARHPFIELLLVLFESLVLFELNDLLSDEVMGHGCFIDDCCAEEVMVLRKR